MKQMTCNELGGACDSTFEADSFEEIAQRCHEQNARIDVRSESHVRLDG